MSCNAISLGLQSLKENSREFLATVLGTGPTGHSSIICGLNDGSLETTSYLNLFQDHECAGSDWVVIGILACLIHIISWVPRWLLWEPIYNARMRGHKSWSVAESRRMSQTCTSALFFITGAIFAWRVLWHREWLMVRSEWWERREPIDPDLKFYYLLFAARFCSDMVSIFFEDRKREAFIAAFIHHVVTITLVLLSAAVGHHHYGSVIMFFFDWADIPLLLAKIFKYLSKDSADAFQWVANRLFETFAVLFFVTRNVLFSYVVFCSVSDMKADFIDRTCKALLLALVGLQTYWLYLVIQAVIRQQAKGGHVEDVREDSEEIKKKD